MHYEILTLIPNRLELLPWSESFIEVNSHDELFTKSFGEIVADLRDDYDAILLDAGSLIENPIAEHVHFWRQMRSDGVMLVVNTKHLESAEVNRMVKTVTLRLQQNHVALLGVAENYV